MNLEQLVLLFRPQLEFPSSNIKQKRALVNERRASSIEVKCREWSDLMNNAEEDQLSFSLHVFFFVNKKPFTWRGRIFEIVFIAWNEPKRQALGFFFVFRVVDLSCHAISRSKTATSFLPHYSIWGLVKLADDVETRGTSVILLGRLACTFYRIGSKKNKMERGE